MTCCEEDVRMGSSSESEDSSRDIDDYDSSDRCIDGEVESEPKGEGEQMPVGPEASTSLCQAQPPHATPSTSKLWSFSRKQTGSMNLTCSRKRVTCGSGVTQPRKRAKNVSPILAEEDSDSDSKKSSGGTNRYSSDDDDGSDNENECAENVHDTTSDESSPNDDKPLKIASIHLICPSNYATLKIDENAIDKEKILIEKLMKTINDNIRKNKNNNGATFEGPTDRTDLHSPQKCKIPFRVSVYVRTIFSADSALECLGIDRQISSNDIMVFYYRCDAIFVFTYGGAWKFISHSTSIEFPKRIRRRVTDPSGSYKTSNRCLLGNIQKEILFNGNLVEIPESKMLTCILENVKMKVRQDSSLYDLEQFKAKKIKLQIEFGLSSIRILKPLVPKHIPQLLHHLLKIWNGAVTYTRGRSTGHPKEMNNKEKILLAQLIPRTHPFSQQLDNKLAAIISRFVTSKKKEDSEAHPIINRYTVCGARTAEWHESTNFKLQYGNKRKSEWEIISTNFPSKEDTFSALRKLTLNWQGWTKEQLIDGIKNLKIVYYWGGIKERSVSLLNTVVGEIPMGAETFWKVPGFNMRFQSDYYFILENRFVEILNKRGVLWHSDKDAKLPKAWGARNTTARQYTDLYKTEDNAEEEENVHVPECYLLAPKEDTSCFDMMLIETEAPQSPLHTITLFYFYNRFDYAMPDTKDILTRKTSNKGNGTSYLNKFWTFYHKKDGQTVNERFFNKAFPTFQKFRDCFFNDQQKVNLIAGVVTGPEGAAYTLQREKELPMAFSVDNVYQLVETLRAQTPLPDMLTLQEKLGVPLREGLDSDAMASKLLEKLQESKYCDKETSKLSGHLLKLPRKNQFELLKDKRLDAILFRGIRNKFLTGFPGFRQKLVIFMLNESVNANGMYKLQFVEMFHH